MIKTYLKQAWTMLRQHKLFSSIYIAGTGLSIALIMTLFIIFYVKIAPIYPEYNRANTAVVGYIDINNNHSGYIGYYWVKHEFPKLKHAKAIGTKMGGLVNVEASVQTDNISAKVPCMPTDGGFWKIFTFDFIKGNAFTQEDVLARRRMAVISESLAKRLFASTDIVGKSILLNGNKFSISGVVRDVSAATPDTYSEVWIPLEQQGVDTYTNANSFRGNNRVYMLTDNPDSLSMEFEAFVHRFNNSQSDFKITFNHTNRTIPQWETGLSNIITDNESAPLKDIIVILLALLIIPALNLSGMLSSRMDSRRSEIGVRKAYGATNSKLVSQVLWENLLLTGIGGLVGLILSYIAVITSSNWIMTLFGTNEYSWYIYSGERIETSLSTEMLFNPYIFVGALSLCLILNVISALIPTLWALRTPIIQSINAKR